VGKNSETWQTCKTDSIFYL